MGTQLLPHGKGHSSPPQFSAYVYCGQTAGCMKTLLGTEVDLGPGHIVLDGVGWLEFNVTFLHKYAYIRDEC